jgi:hypothetical protein
MVQVVGGNHAGLRAIIGAPPPPPIGSSPAAVEPGAVSLAGGACVVGASVEVAGAVVAGAVAAASEPLGSASSSLPQPAATRARAAIRTSGICRRSARTSL